MAEALPITDELKTVRDYIRWAASSFNENQLYYGHGTDNAWDEAVYLVLGALHLQWDTDPTVLDARLTSKERLHLSDLIEQRIKQRIPVAYLIKQAWFAGLPFYIDERVLVPRSPIAELIDGGFSPWLVGDEVNDILDLCTGSGCIGIACAVAFPKAEVVLSDKSTDAIAVAKINCERHYLGNRVTVIESDLFEDLPEHKFDLIVTNPPYVDAHDIETMPDEYRAEPSQGLASGDQGLDCIRRILGQAHNFLNEYGVLVAEVGNSQAALEKAYPDVPFLWLDFERGGHGVFVLTSGQLRQHKDKFLTNH